MTEKPVIPRIAVSVASGMFLAIVFIPSISSAEKYSTPIFLLTLALLLVAQAVLLRLIWGRRFWRFMWHHIVWPIR